VKKSEASLPISSARECPVTVSRAALASAIFASGAMMTRASRLASSKLRSCDRAMSEGSSPFAVLALRLHMGRHRRLEWPAPRLAPGQAGAAPTPSVASARIGALLAYLGGGPSEP
jgi:hypothetical protein